MVSSHMLDTGAECMHSTSTERKFSKFLSLSNPIFGYLTLLIFTTTHKLLHLLVSEDRKYLGDLSPVFKSLRCLYMYTDTLTYIGKHTHDFEL